MRQDDDDDDTLSKLLKLKRYEQPPPEYFERFLRDFQARQRAELLRRPAWRIALDRAEAFFSHITVSQLSYSGASAAVLLIAGVVTVNMLAHPGGRTVATLASAPSVISAAPGVIQAAQLEAAPVRVVSVPAASPSYSSSYLADQFSLTPHIRVPDGFSSETAQPGVSSLHPRYILDARPASYEPPFSF